MGNQILTSQIREANIDPDSFYAKRWNEQSTKQFLTEKIKAENQKLMQENPSYYPKKASEAKLVKQHFKFFHTLDNKDNMLLLMNHPNLERADFEEVLKLSGDALEKSLYTALAGSGITFLIYKNFYQKNTLFYNFFRKPNQFRVTRAGKKVFASLVLFYSWFFSSNYVYKALMNNKINKLGLYDKYYINFQDKYIYD